MSMPIRSHIGRPFDITFASNAAMLALALMAGVVSLILWLNGSPLEVFLAPAHVFLIWALLREIDPDHNWTALVGGAIAGAWVLVAVSGSSDVVVSTMPALAIAGLMLAGRLVTETTGRRPLPVDLAVATAAGIAISFTIEGWISGFGLAIALYLDDRLSGKSRGMEIAAAATTAIGATVVATAARAFPPALPSIEPSIAIAAGLIAVGLVLRDPAEPTCRVDARHAAFIRVDRLHASRSLIGVLVFAMVLLTGSEANGLIPLISVLFLALVSNEAALVRRRAG